MHVVYFIKGIKPEYGWISKAKQYKLLIKGNKMNKKAFYVAPTIRFYAFEEQPLLAATGINVGTSDPVEGSEIEFEESGR